MANDIGTTPWVLDTTGLIWTARVQITLVEWKSPVNVGDTFLLQDMNGRLILDGTCEAALQSQIFRLQPLFYNGLKLTTLQSGVLRVHIR